MTFLNVLIFPKQDRDCAQKPSEVMCVCGGVCPWRNTGSEEVLGGWEVWNCHTQFQTGNGSPADRTVRNLWCVLPSVALLSAQDVLASSHMDYLPV